MQALVERTKIKTETGNISSTTGLDVYSGFSGFYGFSGEIDIDVNAYTIASGSIQIQTQRYIPELSAKAKAILYRIYTFRQLKANWDGNGALAPGEEVIKSTANFLCLLDENDLPIYFTAPGPNGEIVLEYKNGENTAEIFFEHNNFSEMLLYRGKEQVYAGEVKMKQLINHLMAIPIANGR